MIQLTDHTTRLPLFIDVVIDPPVSIEPLSKDPPIYSAGPMSTLIRTRLCVHRVAEDSTIVHDLCQDAIAAANPPDATADSAQDDSET